MSFDFSTCSAEELWKFVSAQLAKHGIEVVLVGGGVVSVYTQGLYESGDLDFIVQNFVRPNVDKAMAEIGFRKKNRYFVHPECKHMFVEFPAGPLGIGDDSNIVPDEHRENQVVHRILSPTDCIKDRLASYIHAKARECLDQAVLVADRHPFNKSAVKAWCERERAPQAYAHFIRSLRAAKKSQNTIETRASRQDRPNRS